MFGRLLVCVAMINAGPGDDPAAGVPGRTSDRAAYEAARKAAGQDAAANVRLALWCEQHGMTAERIKHLAAAVMYDPSNGLARGLLGLVARGGKWEQPDEVSRKAQDDPEQQAVMQEYLRRRAKTPEKADDQAKLAAWCEQVGLKDQAVAHYHAVVRLDPRREAAWKHLGFKKAGRQWIKPEWQAEAKREADEQGRADKHWKPLLEKWRTGLSSRIKARRAEAEAGLSDVTDPRAVPMIWAVFAPRGAEGQRTAVRLLGQVDSPGSSRALTLLALRSPVAEVRREAIQILRMRDPRDFAPMLIGLLRDRIKYEVRPVNGPGSPGELVIKNKGVNVDRVYAPPPTPYVPFLPGDTLGVDAAGLPVIDRVMGVSNVPIYVPNNLAGARAVVAHDAALAQQPHPAFNNMGLPANLAATLDSFQAPSPPIPVRTTIGGKGPNLSVSATESITSTERIPVGQMMLEFQKAARVAELQLEGDVAAIRAGNAAIQESNQQVLQILSGATGVDLGEDRTAWEKWVVDLFGYAYSAPSEPEPQTIVEQVPLAYLPQPVPILPQSPQVTGFQISAQFHYACFGAGTPVRTLDGLRPIETLRVGDLVLTQDPRNGELKYQAVVTVYHNPPNATFRLAMEGGESIVVTGIHRLWKAGKGWTMARELKAGDVLRTLGGLASVKAVEADRTQLVYNLQVADGESYFVGKSGVLAHDNSPINPVPEPFDAVAPLAEVAPSTNPRPRSMLGR